MNFLYLVYLRQLASPDTAYEIIHQRTQLIGGDFLLVLFKQYFGHTGTLDRRI